MSWQDILDTEINPGKPPKSSIFYRLRDNLVAVAQRMTGAPVVQVPVVERRATTGASTWSWPDGVTAVRVRAVGGGGGGTAGGDTTLTYNGITYTAHGGAAGVNNRVNTAAGGTTVNMTQWVNGFSSGHYGTGETGGDSVWGKGGYTLGTRPAEGYGAGGGGVTTGNGYTGGGGGAYGEVWIERVAGLDTIALSVGAGGTATVNVAAGTQGIIVLDY